MKKLTNKLSTSCKVVLSLLLFFLINMPVIFAQDTFENNGYLIDDGGLYQVPFNHTLRDLIIPAGTKFDRIALVARGADGGRRISESFGKLNHLAGGGEGATTKAQCPHACFEPLEMFRNFITCALGSQMVHPDSELSKEVNAACLLAICEIGGGYLGEFCSLTEDLDGLHGYKSEVQIGITTARFVIAMAWEDFSEIFESVLMTACISNPDCATTFRQQFERISTDVQYLLHAGADKPDYEKSLEYRGSVFNCKSPPRVKLYKTAGMEEGSGILVNNLAIPDLSKQYIFDSKSHTPFDEEIRTIEVLSGTWQFFSEPDYKGKQLFVAGPTTIKYVNQWRSTDAAGNTDLSFEISSLRPISCNAEKLASAGEKVYFGRIYQRGTKACMQALQGARPTIGICDGNTLHGTFYWDPATGLIHKMRSGLPLEKPGLCLQVDGANLNSAVVLNTCDPANKRQQWDYDEVTGRLDSRQVAGGSLASIGTDIFVGARSSSQTTSWDITWDPSEKPMYIALVNNDSFALHKNPMTNDFSNGVAIHLWPGEPDKWSNDKNKLWTYDHSTQAIRMSAIPAKCIDLPRSNTANGTPVELYDCNGSPNQQWILGDGLLRSGVDNDKCLILEDRNTEKSNPAVLWDCGDPNISDLQKRWEFKMVSDDHPVYISLVANSAKSLAKKGVLENVANGTSMWLYDKYIDDMYEPNKQWIYEETTQTIRLAMDPSKCLDVPGSNTANSTPIELYNCHGGPNQQWIYQDNLITSALDHNKCLIIKHNNFDNENPILLWDCVNVRSEQKKWVFTY